MTFVPADDELQDGIELPSLEEIEAALRNVPDDLTWEWAAARLVPLFERGYGEGASGDPMVNTVSHLGVGIGLASTSGRCSVG